MTPRALVVAALLSGCECGTASHLRDDAGGLDATRIDAGGRVDAGPPDTGPRDAGPRPPEHTCEESAASGSTYGCELWIVDLDNAAIAVGRDAASAPFGVLVVNPGEESAEVTIETFDRSLFVTRAVAPGAVVTFDLGKHEVDGSTPLGMDDGTHTALTLNGIRLRSTRPVAVHQMNPLAVDDAMFSNEGSLLLPTHAWGTRYTVVGWPQTIADDPSMDPDYDFDVSTTGEDLRAFLTVVGREEEPTRVRIELGPDVVRVMGAGAVPLSGPGDTIEVELLAFEVLNLETEGLGADFTGSVVEASAPVGVFVGSEASDVPHFETYAERQCCADHLESQLPPDDRGGLRHVIGLAPSRAEWLNDAFTDPTTDSVAESPPREWVRIVATQAGRTAVRTTLPAPHDRFTLLEREWREIETVADFVIDSDQPVTVLQAQPSQEVTGIPPEYPGGDPSISVVPSVQRFRSRIDFAIPEGYSFDAIVVLAPAGASVALDGETLGADCETSAGLPDWQIWRCRMSAPDVVGLPRPRAGTGVQRDGYHVLTADRPIGAYVTGFHAFVSYAFPAAL